jgi:hypothetical protein
VRRSIIVLATIILAGSTFAAAVGLWVDAEIADEDAFVASSLESFSVEGSYEAIGTSMATKVIDAYPSLELLGATLETLFAALVATEPFEPLLADVATQVYEVAVDGSGAPVLIDLAEYRDVVLESLAAISPDLAARVPAGVFTSFELFGAGELPDASLQIDAMTAVGWLAVVVAMAMVVLLVLFLRRGRLALGSIGAALLVGAGSVAVFIPLGRLAAGWTFTNEAYLVLSQNLYDTLVIPLWQRAWIIGGAGLVLVGIAAVGSVTSSRRSGPGG